MTKFLRFKDLSVFTKNGFSVIEGKKYPVTRQDTNMVFTEDENGKSIGISNVANPTIVEILNDIDEIINEEFVVHIPTEEEMEIMRGRPGKPRKSKSEV